MTRLRFGIDSSRLSMVAVIGVTALLASCSERSTTAFQGYVEGEFVAMGAAEPGRLLDLKVQRGGQVKAGQALFTLESDFEAAQLRQAQGQFDSALSQLADMKLGKRPPEIAVVVAQLAEAKAVDQRAQLQWRRDDVLYRQNAVSQADWEQSRSAAETAAAKVVELTQQVLVAKLPSRIDQIKAQMAAVEAAKAAVASAQWRFDQKRVASPADALVFDTLYREGEWVAAGNPVVSLLPPGNIKVRFFVGEPALGSIKLGQTVVVSCDVCAKSIAVKIDYISTESEFTPPIIYSNETRSKLVYRIEARPAIGEAPSLHPGQPVTVTMR